MPSNLFKPAMVLTPCFILTHHYLVDTKGKKDGKLKAKQLYQVEFSEDDHSRLAEVLQSCNAASIVSGYPSKLYEKLYKGWDRIEMHVEKDNGAGSATEVLWISPNAQYHNLFNQK